MPSLAAKLLPWIAGVPQGFRQIPPAVKPDGAGPSRDSLPGGADQQQQDKHPRAAGTELKVVRNATCTFCGCVCDDMERTVEDNHITKTKIAGVPLALSQRRAGAQGHREARARNPAGEAVGRGLQGTQES